MLEAMELRKSGKTYVQIGTELGISDVAAYNLVRRAINRLDDATTEIADSVRRLELDRLDHMLEKLKPKLDNGNIKAIETAIKIQERRSKYLGLDAPEKKDLRVFARPHELAQMFLENEDSNKVDSKLVQ